MNPTRTQTTPNREHAVTPASVAAWTILFVGLAVLVARRLGAFDLWASVTTSSGQRVRMPMALAQVDHPFHAVRAESLRRALADGEMLRWIGHHQGGYPVEFYPLGAAGLDVLAWALALGSLPMVLIHKLVVIGIFLAPLVGYVVIAGFDRRSLGVALLAGMGHLVVRGWWWSGGAMELYEWGLVTNVAAATALLIALPLTVNALFADARRSGAFAVLLGGFALVTNPRSGIALGTLVVGATLATVVAPARPRAGAIVRRLVVLLAAMSLLAAPELIALARYSDLYYFVRYQEYADLDAYWRSSIRAVGGPAFVLGIVGAGLALLPGARLHHRAVALALGCYVAVTAAVVADIVPQGIVEQLETPRLMPFQRFLWFVLAAIALEVAARFVLRILHVRSLGLVTDVAMVALAGAVLVLYVIRPPTFIPEGDRGLVAMPTAATTPGIADLEEAVKAADGAAADGTGLLVLGITQPGTLQFHDQLWAPLWSDRPFFYDDWLWYWQTKHFGAYNPLTEHAYPNDASALDPEYLRRHGIGAVVVTGDAKGAAERATYLTRIRSGTWDVYTVNQPTSIVTFDGSAPAAISVGNQSLSATGTTGGGEILIRRNWFPRWRATVNGQEVPIRETDDGYMAITAPADGVAQVELTYVVDWLDWLGRIAAALGVVAVILLLLPRRTTVRLRPGGPRSVPRARPRVRPERR